MRHIAGVMFLTVCVPGALKVNTDCCTLLQDRTTVYMQTGQNDGRFVQCNRENSRKLCRCKLGCKSACLHLQLSNRQGSLCLTPSNRLGRATIGTCLGAFSKLPFSSPSIAKRERPGACDSNSCWESKRCIRETRSVQSSSNSHLQNISTRGRSCIHVLRMACREGGGG